MRYRPDNQNLLEGARNHFKSFGQILRDISPQKRIAATFGGTFAQRTSPLPVEYFGRRCFRAHLRLVQTLALSDKRNMAIGIHNLRPALDWGYRKDVRAAV